MIRWLFISLLCGTFVSFSQESIPDTTALCQTLRGMIENDAKYLNGDILKSGTFGRKEIYPKKVKDSVWVLQRTLDAENTEKLLQLTKKYGWLSDERIVCPKLNIWLIFRHSPKKYYKEILELIEKEYAEKRLHAFHYHLIKDHVTGKY